MRIRELSMVAALLGLIAFAPRVQAQSPVKVFLGLEVGSVPMTIDWGLGGSSKFSSSSTGWSIGGEAGVKLPVLGLRGGVLYRRCMGSVTMQILASDPGATYGMNANEWGFFAEATPLPIPVVEVGIGLQITSLTMDDTWSGYGLEGPMDQSTTGTRLYAWGGVPFIKKAKAIFRLGYNWGSVDQGPGGLESEIPNLQTVTASYDGVYIAGALRYNIIG